MQYYFSIDGANQQGPTERDQLLAAGVRPDTMIWREGWANWMRAGDAAELSDLFGAAPAAPISPPQYPGAQPHLQPAYETPIQGPGSSGMAIASMVLGIVGLFTCCWFIPSILAVIFGHIAKSEIRRTGRGGGGMATAGLVMGYIGLILGVLTASFSIFGQSLNVSGRGNSFNNPPVVSPIAPGR